MPTRLFASSTEIQALIVKAKSDRKPDSPLTIERMLSLTPYRTGGPVVVMSMHVPRNVSP